MLSSFEDTIQKLEAKMTSHPNVCTLWKFYLQRKLERLENDLSQCNNVLEDILPHVEDIPMATMFVIGQIPLSITRDTDE